MGAKAEVADLVKALQRQGFKTEYVPNGHIKVTAPDGRKCQIAGTPKDKRNILNAKSRLKRRVGFDPKA